MTVRSDGDVIHLEGACHLEDAEPLTVLLQQGGACSLELSACVSMHGAVVQAILAFRPPLLGLPEGHFLSNLLLPALGAARQSAARKL